MLSGIEEPAASKTAANARAAIRAMAVFAAWAAFASGLSGCIACSHLRYLKRAEAARNPPAGEAARPGRIYFASFPENRLAAPVFGWHPEIGHASLLTDDRSGTIKQYDYGWFVGHGGERPRDAIGYGGDSPSYGVVRRKVFPRARAAKATNDMEVARMALDSMPGYGGRIQVWAKDVPDVGVAERYMENLAEDAERGSMAWRFFLPGGYRCGNISRQAFDAARGEYHWLDLLWGGFPGADAPSVGTDKTECRAAK